MFSQVGINTKEPDSLMSLDVNGKVKIRSMDEKTDLVITDHILLPTTDGEIKKATLQSLLSTIHPNKINNTVTKFINNREVSLITVSAFGNWSKVNFKSSHAQINLENFHEGDDFYKVPNDGIYHINFYYKASSISNINLKIRI